MNASNHADEHRRARPGDEVRTVAYAAARALVSSVEPPSTTITSHGPGCTTMASSVPSMRAASFSVGMTTEIFMRWCGWMGALFLLVNSEWLIDNVE